MLYSVLIYDSEAITMSRSQAEDDELVARHVRLQAKLVSEGKLGPVVRLMPTSAAVTVRQGRETVVTDGPFAETKEQLLGLYILDCPTLEEAIAAARQIGEACGPLALEVRPIRWFRAGADAEGAVVTAADVESPPRAHVQ
ncbi:MAG TPA: YciI family protein [Steroidobacteraceae bacterium]|nr:YciI family protein [Steroidobacteraceae bacterium]